MKTSFKENYTSIPSLCINTYLEEKSNIEEFFDKFGLKEDKKYQIIKV